MYQSRPHNILERVRSMVTDKQPFRCHACGWRKWRGVVVHEDTHDVRPDDLRTGRVPKPVTNADLDQLDTPTPPA